MEEKKYHTVEDELADLRQQLEEANDTIEAIRTGQVDALIINNTEHGHQLYTLRSVDQTYRLFIEKMSEGAVTLDREGIILYSNSSFAKKLGIKLNRIIGVPFINFVTGAHRTNFGNQFKLSWLREVKTELNLVDQKGKEISFLLSFATLELEEGTSVSIILTDLSDQKETELKLKTNNKALEEARENLIKANNHLELTVKERTHELQLSQEYFKMLANSMPQMCWTNDRYGDVDFYNERWYEYTGLNFEQARNEGWKAFLHPDDLAQTIEKYNSSLERGKRFAFENRYRKADGTYRWQLNRGVPVKNDNGQIFMWVCTATDINDQRMAMEKKDEFIGIASHELKTPLTSVKGYLQLINAYDKQPLPAIIKQFLERANLSINKLENLVNDLLDVSKIQAGKLEFKKEMISTWQLITSCEDSARLIYPDFEFILDVNDDFKILGNAERLEQVIMNFISNAVKYSGKSKKIILSVGLEEEDQICIAVQDFGIGLTDTEKANVFDRFYRVEDKQYHTSGLGMGLFISSEIIKNHHGEIGLESKFGEGSTFYFILPAYKS